VTRAHREQVARIERQLAAAQQITHVGSWEWDLATNVVIWSDELYRIYGLEPQSRTVSFEFFVSCVHPDDRARVEHEVLASVDQGSRFAYLERIVRPDGTVRVLDTRSDVVRGADGRVIRLLGTCRDVTAEQEREETIRIHADIVRNVPTAISVWEVGDATDPSSLRLVSYNPASEAIAGRSLTGCLGLSLRTILPRATGGRIEAMVLDVARDGRVREAVVERSRPPMRALAAKLFGLPGGRVGLAVEEVTQTMRARLLRDAEHVVLEQIASGTALADVLESVVCGVEKHSPTGVAAVFLLDPTGKRLRTGAAPSLPADYTRAIERTAVGPSATSYGAAVWRRDAVFVDDTDADPLWAGHRELARTHHVRACWSTPILSANGRLLGVFALHHCEPVAPSEVDRDLMKRATQLARIAIERNALEDELRALSAHEEAVREDERTGIAREIHDVLGQALTALKMDLALVGRRLAREQPAPAVALLERIQAMSDMTDDVLRQVRRISAELRPGMLDDLGLLAAVEWQAHEFEQRTGTACTVRSNLGETPVGRELSTAVFRILQEALTNAARHAWARRVDVELLVDGAALALHVHDDGRGIAPEEASDPRSFGLLGIRERARRLGGMATIGPREPRGTSLTLVVPLTRAASLP
jgi:PAS domain S-box-containing protein